MTEQQPVESWTVRSRPSRYVARMAAWSTDHFGAAYASATGTPSGCWAAASRTHASLTATRMSPAPSKRLSAT